MKKIAYPLGNNPSASFLFTSDEGMLDFLEEKRVGSAQFSIVAYNGTELTAQEAVSFDGPITLHRHDGPFFALEVPLEQ
jgi:hypothetical protein